MKCTRAGASVLRIAVMVMAPLICTNKYDNLSIKLVATAVRTPRVWDESCEKKREKERESCTDDAKSNHMTRFKKCCFQYEPFS